MLCKFSKSGNYRIFLSLRFYVKSILDKLEMLFFCNFGALNLVDLVDFGLQKVQKIIKSQNSVSECTKMIDYSRILKINFT